jgi:hypothetical protein
MMSHLGRKSMKPEAIYAGDLPPASEFSREAVEELNDIADAARSRRARVYFLFPSYMDRAYNNNASAIAGLQSRLEREMRIPILGAPKDFVYPSNWFFDTRYHLNDLGRGPRTANMVEILRAVRHRDRW